MHSTLKTSLAALVAAGVSATTVSADGHGLSGELNIISDMSNPAPRAVMEGMAADFDAMHPNLTVNLTVPCCLPFVEVFDSSLPTVAAFDC